MRIFRFRLAARRELTTLSKKHVPLKTYKNKFFNVTKTVTIPFIFSVQTQLFIFDG